MRGNTLFKFLDRYAGIAFVWILSLLQRRRTDVSIATFEPRRILVVKFVAIGDAVLLVPSLRSLRARYPRAEIIFLGTSLIESIISRYPRYVDRFVAIDIGLLARRPAYAWRMLQKIRRLDCDVAVDYEQWSRLSPILLGLARIPVLCGFRTKVQYRHYLYTHAVDRDWAKHEVENFLSLTSLLTGATTDADITLDADESALVHAQAFLMKNGWKRGSPIVIVHPGCGAHGFPREWPAERYAELLTRMGSNGGAFNIVTGAPSEVTAMQTVQHGTKVPNVLYIIADLNEFVALVSMASMFISGNNGAMHIAAALRVPQIALHGPTNAAQWGPRNPKAIIVNSSCPGCPCLDLGFEYHRRDGFCMEQIGVDELVGAAMALSEKYF